MALVIFISRGVNDWGLCGDCACANEMAKANNEIAAHWKAERR
jgi:hypothetical protein